MRTEDLDQLARTAMLLASSTTYASPADEGPRYVFTTLALQHFALLLRSSEARQALVPPCNLK